MDMDVRFSGIGKPELFRAVVEGSAQGQVTVEVNNPLPAGPVIQVGSPPLRCSLTRSVAGGCSHALSVSASVAWSVSDSFSQWTQVGEPQQVITLQFSIGLCDGDANQIQIDTQSILKMSCGRQVRRTGPFFALCPRGHRGGSLRAHHASCDETSGFGFMFVWSLCLDRKYVLHYTHRSLAGVGSRVVAFVVALSQSLTMGTGPVPVWIDVYGGFRVAATTDEPVTMTASAGVAASASVRLGVEWDATSSDGWPVGTMPHAVCGYRRRRDAPV